MKKFAVWTGALVTGVALGLAGIGWVDSLADFVATVYTRLFRLLAVPTVVLAVVTTFATFGHEGSGRIFGRTLAYTLLTTLAAAVVGALLFVVVAPQNLSVGLAGSVNAGMIDGEEGYYQHFLTVIPDNMVKPFLEGNVLSLLIVAFAVGIGLSKMKPSENKDTLEKGLLGLQELLFLLIRWLISTLPLGIVAYAAQLSAQLSAGVAAGSLGRYVAVIVGGNVIQFFVVLPLFLLLRGRNPVRVMRAMLPAVMTALFTKSSAATLPLTIHAAEHRLGVRRQVARFVLPLCTTINMNGCAAFIAVTSLFVMQNGGIVITPQVVVLWTLLSVVAAVGNAGVPMGCYFLTLSLMTSVGAPVALMGVILPIYTVIDMIETAENVWSDSCVCAAVDIAEA